jgi:hypothetical protein
MENNEVTFRKIPLKVLIDILHDAWDKGADYVDIMGVPNEVQDNIAIAIREEYMGAIPADGEEEYDINVELEEGEDLTDEDLNQLL